MNETNNNDSAMEIIAQVLQEQKYAQGDAFSYSKVNLAELERLTGLSRQRLRTLKKHQFMEVSHGNTGKDNHRSVLNGYTSTLDELLINGVSNSTVCLERLREKGYTGSQSTVKRYIKKHSDLIPAKRKAVAPQGSRGRRYQTGPGETFQMDWGFANVTAHDGSVSKIACFAMICHHCGMRYIEFFPNAKQENLFIGMLNAFVFMGIPSFVLTDNMKSVVMLRMSRLPLKSLKTFENFDFSVLHGRDVDKLKAISSLSAVYSHRNLAFIGPTGTGKTHLAQAFGYECCKRGMKTYFIKMTELRDRFDAARRTGKEGKLLNGLIRYSCLIIDEVGHCDFDKENTRLFFDLIDRRCNTEGNSSIIFTSNKNPARWRENFNDEDSLLCALDRLFDDATVYKLRGQSYRGKKLETINLEVGTRTTSSENPTN